MEKSVMLMNPVLSRRIKTFSIRVSKLPRIYIIDEKNLLPTRKNLRIENDKYLWSKWIVFHSSNFFKIFLILPRVSNWRSLSDFNFPSKNALDSRKYRNAGQEEPSSALHGKGRSGSIFIILILDDQGSTSPCLSQPNETRSTPGFNPRTSKARLYREWQILTNVASHPLSFKKSLFSSFSSLALLNYRTKSSENIDLNFIKENRVHSCHYAWSLLTELNITPTTNGSLNHCRFLIITISWSLEVGNHKFLIIESFLIGIKTKSEKSLYLF